MSGQDRRAAVTPTGGELDVSANSTQTGGERSGGGRLHLSRRAFIGAAGAMAAAGALTVRGLAAPSASARAAGAGIKQYVLAATDGWIAMPDQAAPVPPFYPDPYAPSYTANRGVYVFGFRDITGHDDNPGDFINQAQSSAPILFFDAGTEARIRLHNLGLLNRPDLFDSHTVHWHGFANQIPYFDGVPQSSLSVPQGSFLDYQFFPDLPGTYMYHCHFEDVEHVQMGMQGSIFVRPAGHPNWVYDDASTQFDRQFCLHLNEVFLRGHYGDAHLQGTDWTEFQANFSLINGRAFPDTIAPGTGNPLTEPTGPLQFQPNSALVEATSGERILLRVSNLGYQEHALELPGVELLTVGADSKFLGDGRPDYYGNLTRGDIETRGYEIVLGPGESRDVIFTAPTVTAKTVFPLFDRSYGFVRGKTTGTTYGGMRTEVHVYPPSANLPAQGIDNPNQVFSL